MLSAITISIATVGGAAVITLLKDEVLFGWYAIGLAIGLLVDFAPGLGRYGKEELQLWQMPPAPFAASEGGARCEASSPYSDGARQGIHLHRAW